MDWYEELRNLLNNSDALQRIDEDVLGRLKFRMH
jgi:hypothetical protein